MTKLLTIGLLMLSYGMVEAKQDIYTDCIQTAPSGETYNICRMSDLRKILEFENEPLPRELAICDPDMTKCETPCEKKMREAMKIAEKYMYDPSYTLTTESCGAVCKAERELERAKQEQADLLKWDAVMKECVK